MPRVAEGTSAELVLTRSNTGKPAGGGSPPPPSDVPLVFVTNSAVSNTGSAGSPQSFNTTITDLTQGYVVAHLSYYGGAFASGVTFDGVAMVLLSQKSHGVDANIRCQLWGLAVDDKAAGTYACAVSGIGGFEFAGFTSVWQGVDQDGPVGTPATADGNSTTPAVNITSEIGEYVVDVVGRYNGGAATADAGQTEIVNYNSGSGVTDVAGSYQPGSSTTSMGWSFGGAQWVMASVGIVPATGVPSMFTSEALLHFEVTPQEVTDSVMTTAAISNDEVWQTLVSATPGNRIFGADTPGATPNITVDAAAARALQFPVTANATPYEISGIAGMRCVMSENACISTAYDSPGKQLSLGFWFRFNGPYVDNAPRDLVFMGNIDGYQVFQVYDNNNIEGPYFHAHWSPGGAGVGNDVFFTKGEWLWISMAKVNGGQTFKVCAQRYIAATGEYELVGESTGAVSGTSTLGVTRFSIGIIKYYSDLSQSVDYDSFVINYDGVYPIPPLTPPA